MSLEDRRLLARTFAGTLTFEVGPMPNLNRPMDFLTPQNEVQHFKILAGRNAGAVEEHRLTRGRETSAAAEWRYELGAGEVGFVTVGRTGDLMMRGIEDHADNVLTRYAPFEPMLLKDVPPGEQKHFDMAVKIYDLQRPDRLSHEGALHTVYENLGGYQLHLGKASVESVLIKITYQGKIGPARLDAVQFRFFAPRSGMVASAEFRDVSAYIVYHDRSEFAQVLISRPDTKPKTQREQRVSGGMP